MSKNKFKSNYESETNMGNNYTVSSSTSDVKSSSSAFGSSSFTSTVSSGVTIKSNIDVKTAPVTSASVTSSAVKKEEAKPAVENINVTKMNKLLKDYETAVAKQSLLGNGKYDSIAVMISICEYLNRNTDPAVFETFFRYFQRNQNGNMFYDVALNGIHTIQNKMVKTRVSATHACYLELARVRSLKSGHFKFSLNSMKVMCISDVQAKWIINKSQTRS